ncbi:putative manganese-transporting ATPase PDR2 [Citrus sinensis]|uniref:Manganese-transporting ATPase PDR2 n=1 Tax=Citrus sinensis TaxID=2711 RepID=A0ACB8M769_CITSI|nr:putative manganese-transporting ATPase PDR2 [Citrus sinensis]
MLSFHVGGKVVDRVDLLRKKHWVWRLDVWPFAILYSGWLIAIVPSIDFGDAAIVLGGLVAFHILVWLFTAWSVDFKCFAHYSKINDIHLADACKITPVKFCGSKEVVPLQFWKQVFCVGLWCLDEYWYYSLFTLFMLFMFESTMAKSRLKTLTEIRRVRVDNQTIMVHRCGKWVKLAGTDLVPGDVVSIGRSSGQTGEDKSVPADMLILGGSAIVNEAILTGESTPQWKVSIMGRETGEKLSARRDKSHVLFGGTKILQHTPDKTFPLKTPDGGCLAVVLRTGFETSQGKLMRTILFSTERVTANSWESGLFILFLVVFAVIAAGYVLKKGMEDPTRSKYKLFLSCSLIITSVIPPELPMELSIAVNTSLIALARRGIFCTEPFRIPFAGKVDMCCFDKTGTLTSDDMEFRGVVGLSNAELEDDMTKVPVRTQEILASCHALVFVDNKLVGDPLEKAALKGIDWSYKSDEKAMPKRGGGNAVQIVQRHHFASHLKRMSVVVRVQEEFFAFVKRIHELIVRGDMQVVHQTPAFNVVSNTRLLLTGCGRCMAMYFVSIYRSTLLIGRFVFELFSDIRALFMAHKRYLSSSFAVMQEKGAPETIQDRLTDLPSSYIETYKKYTHQGSRVLALAFKSLPDMTVFNCPIREDSAKILSELKNSSQDLAMITGDQALTACYVASQVHIVTKPVLILCPVKNGKVYEWVSPDETEKIQYSEKEVEGLTDAHDLCIGGDCFEMLQQTSAVLRVIPYVKVFARVAPEQKELILTTFKAVGRMTLMCGDGTNDVGALKQAHVGVALLNAVPPTQSGNSSSEASKDENTKSVKSKKSKSASEAASKAMSLNSEGTSKGKASARLEANSRTAGNRHLTAAEMQREKLKKMMEELNEEGDGRSAPIVKLGDASMASPFTAKHASVAPTTDIIRQGRSTLVTTLQMFKILGLNCLATAYVLSVMYLDGVKLGDVQATISGVFTAAFFLFISHARPLPTLSAARPHPNIFCSYVFLSLMGQFAIHLFFLISSVKEAEKYMPDECIEPDADFHPNLVNTVSYMVNMMIQVATFAVNYMGHPFNQSISENKPFMYALMGAVGFFTVITSDLLRSLNDWLKLVPLPSGLRDKLLIWAGLMFLGCYSWERFLRWAFPGKVPAWRKRQRLAAANLEKKHV